ncbi:MULTISPECIES: dUTP diphosphatase [Bacillus]|uniref:dUTPase n=1 Tax=Bacillus velezensis TaxID=492670 RepID=A0ABC8D967_BACVE|nr:MULTISPECIES: dUTP diphosphatase [Bacillus]AJC23677.1 dUTPase [Bacillus sp. Pc3]ANB49554.1 dUTPase [Bacillus velezensis]AQP98106.1 dUTPase [Bacillus sp. 275]AVI28721.1 dUTPase [Bacillus velezensis]AWX72373.1 dUTPase [Bacillus velezensis]
MNLQKMFEMQKVLDDRIIKEKGLEGQDLLPNLILALQVELAECANEWRGFKHWSNNQKPRTKVSTNVGATPENASFFRCENDNCGEHLSKKDFENLFDPDYEECPICKVGDVTAFRDTNPLLEEYVDCLHFILSIGNRIGFDNGATIQQIMRRAEERELETNIGIGKAFSHLMSLVYGFYFSIEDEWTYVMSFERFLNLGKLLGFAPEQIEAAYMDKNAVNHQRQQEGY